MFRTYFGGGGGGGGGLSSEDIAAEMANPAAPIGAAMAAQLASKADLGDDGKVLSEQVPPATSLSVVDTETSAEATITYDSTAGYLKVTLS